MNTLIKWQVKKQYYSKSDCKWKERPVINAEELEKFEKGRSLITAVEWNPFMSKLPPYSEYVFAQKEVKHKRIVDKPKPKWINIIDEYKKRQKKKYNDKGASMINFDQLGEISEEDIVDDPLFQYLLWISSVSLNIIKSRLHKSLIDVNPIIWTSKFNCFFICLLLVYCCSDNTCFSLMYYKINLLLNFRKYRLKHVNLSDRYH